MSLKRVSLALCLVLVLTGIYIEPVYAAVIFSDGFETGDFTAWTGTGGAAPSVQGIVVHHGSYAAQFDLGEYAYYTIGPAIGTAYGRVYVRFNLLPGNADDRFGIVSIDDSGTTNGCQMELWNDAGTVKWRLFYYTGAWGSIVSTDPAPATGTLYCIEVKWIKNSATGAEFWINGVSQGTGGTTANIDVDRFLVGDRYSFATATEYIDCCVLADAYIGPEGGAPTNYPRSATQGITVGVDADRWFQGYRGGTQAIGFTPDGERIYRAMRSPTQAITLASAATRTLVLSRAASQAINTVMEALGVKSVVTNFVRSATQSIVFTSVTNHSLISLLIRVVDALGQALGDTSVAVWGSGGELIYSDSTGTHGYTDAIPFAAPT